MRLIPAIDIIGGKCVRLTRGDYGSRKEYSQSPLEAARTFEENGLQYLHLVDLEGARSERIVNYRILETICSATTLKVDFGGGVKSDEDVRIAFESGAAQVCAGSMAVKDPPMFKRWLSIYGSRKIILGADARDRMVATGGWAEASALDVLDFVKGYEKEGIRYVICTDIGRDGMLEGPAVELYREILAASRIDLIASGGVTSVEDLAALGELGCEGAIIWKALYEGKINLKQLRALC